MTRRYDKLKNLISERIDRYQIDYDKAKDREVSFSSMQFYDFPVRSSGHVIELFACFDIIAMSENRYLKAYFFKKISLLPYLICS